MTQEEMNDYLSKIRKTIADSEAAIEAAGLRLRETDRFLERQGLTRQQVLDFRFTREQRLLANEELRRRGLPPIEEEDASVSFSAATDALRDASAETGSADPLADRQRAFGEMMQNNFGIIRLL